MTSENIATGSGREAELRRKKRDFDIMTSNVIIEHQKHLLAALHCKAVYDRLLFLPSILLTLLSGALAVVAQSDLYSDDDRTKSVLGLSISILSAVSVFWQSWMKQQDLGGRARVHDSAATALSKLCKSARIKSIDVQNGIENMGHDPTSSGQDRGGRTDSERLEGGDASAEEPPANNGEKNEFDALSKQFDQALDACTSVVPVNITAAFNALDTRINVCNRNLFPSADGMPEIAWERVYPALYYQMTLTITGSRLWPYIVPEAKWTVERTIDDFKKLDANVVRFIVAQAQEIDENFGTIATERTAAAADGGADAKMGSSALKGGAGLEEPLLSSGENV